MQINPLFWALTFGLFNNLNASRILFLIPYGSESHNIFYRNLISGLAKRNHSITIISYLKVMNEMSDIIHETVVEKKRDFVTPNFLEMRRKGITHHLIYELGEIANPACENFLSTAALRNVLQKGREEPFDVLLTGSLVYECAIPVSHILSIPRIMVSSAAVLPWLDYTFGNPHQWAYVPNLFLGYHDHMSFLQRCYNVLYSLSSTLHRQLVYLPELDSLIHKHLGPDIPSLSKLDHEVSLALINIDPSMDYPRPTHSNMIYLGGLHINNSQKLPKDLKTFMDDAGNAGVVIFSMGTVVKDKDFPMETKAHLIEAFKSIPQRVVWKWNGASPPSNQMPENIMLVEWLPQQAALGHPNVKAFITHGGLGSSMEAVYNAVPIIGIPIFGDQDYNVMRAVRDGSGVFLEFNNLTTSSLLEALNKVIHNSRYKEAMLRRSEILKDKFADPVSLGVYYIEYVIRHSGASHLRPASLDLPWYKLNLLDVYFVFLLLIVLISIALFKIMLALYHLMTKSLEKQKYFKKKLN